MDTFLVFSSLFATEWQFLLINFTHHLYLTLDNTLYYPTYSYPLSNKSKILEKRLRYLTDYFTYSLYCNVCRSLFEKDKLLFSFVLSSNILKAKNGLEQEELMFFLTGGVGLENKIPNPDSSWLIEKSWDEICRMCDFKVFQGFRYIKSNNNFWKKDYNN